jgi:predicted nucleotidyltransferase
VASSVTEDGPTGISLDPTTVERMREVLERRSVAFAMVFGSQGQGTADADSDIDIAVEFTDIRPADDGYSTAYFRLVTDLTDALDVSVDVIDVHLMPPRFAHAAFDTGTVVHGTETRRRQLADELAGDPITLDEARSRVSAAVERMKQ